MTVKELIERLKEFPEDMEVLDGAHTEIEDVFEGTWTDANFPNPKPDKQVVFIY